MADRRHPDADAVAHAAELVRRAAGAEPAPADAPDVAAGAEVAAPEVPAPAPAGAAPAAPGQADVAVLAARALEQLDALEAALGVRRDGAP